MSEPALTREVWRYLIKSAYGLKGVADTLDESPPSPAPQPAREVGVDEFR